MPNISKPIYDKPSTAKPETVEVESTPKPKPRSTKDDPRPLQAIAPDEHKDREGASEHSGYQPKEKFSPQGSKPY